MKFLILGRPRCRTSFMGDVFRSQFNAPNFHESFDNTDQIKNQIIRAKLAKADNLENTIQHILKKHYIDVTNNVFKTEHSVIKFFPRYIVYPKNNILQQFNSHKDYPYYIKDYSNPQFSIINDYIQVFQLEKYDEILFLNRDLLNSTLSYIFNIFITHIPLYSSDNQVKFFKQKNVVTSIDKTLFPYINFYVYEYILQKQIKQDLIDLGIKFTELDYDQCLPYVENRFGKIPKVRFSDPKFDYSQIITNYSEIKSYVNAVYDTFNKNQ